jgi:CheY-like chemotaxis protein
MSRILLVDDSPHALRMGERILGEEGYEVVALSNADSALIRLDDVDPDVVIADATMPGRTGYEICQYLKMSPRHRHVRVLITLGSLESIDEELYRRAGADGSLKKPFEATGLLAAVKSLAEAAARDRAGSRPAAAREANTAASAAPFVAVIDAGELRAAITVALDAAMEMMVREISDRVLETLKTRQPDPPRASKPTQALAPAPDSAMIVERPLFAPAQETGARFRAFRKRPGSILGLSLEESAPAVPEAPRDTEE